MIKRGLLGASAIAHVVYEKYVNALPLNRQEEDWKRFGISISRATLANEVIYVAERWLLLLWKFLKADLLKSGVIHADETVVQVNHEPGRKPSSESRMWVYVRGTACGPPIRSVYLLRKYAPLARRASSRYYLFEYQITRGGEHAKAFLEGFDGYLQTDGYGGYNAVEGVTRCGCWAHERRKFIDAIPKTENKKGKAHSQYVRYANAALRASGLLAGT